MRGASVVWHRGNLTIPYSAIRLRLLTPYDCGLRPLLMAGYVLITDDFKMHAEPFWFPTYKSWPNKTV
jgi:hypothetical protein